MDRISRIETFVRNQSDIEIIENFRDNIELPGHILGLISVKLNAEKSLQFEVSINPLYPFKFQNQESILFKNVDLLQYDHIMKDGNICIHTSHSIDLEQKIEYDFNSLRFWISKYYTDSVDEESNYEHVITPISLFEDNYHTVCFNNICKAFVRGEFGLIELSETQSGIYNGKLMRNFYLQSFHNIHLKEITSLQWNPRIKSLNRTTAIYTYVESIPAENGKFAFENWGQIASFLDQKFLDALYQWDESFFEKGQVVHLLIGYKIPNGEIHWELIILKGGELPIKGIKNQNKKWITTLIENKNIVWGSTQNISYEYFFGRGKLENPLTDGKVLLIGIGAVGSIVANTLIRGGCKDVCIIDFDTKYPENICRSEYTLNPLVCSKVEDLQEQLYNISPYVTIPAVNVDLKYFFNNTPEKLLEFEGIFNGYDFVFDCTTDNDLLYWISQLNLTKNFFSFSISNKAVQLVAACNANRYKFSQTQFNDILNYDIDDLHEPIGCWSPTFKASYNDINLLVQTALKHINLKIKTNKTIANFVIETSFEDNLKIVLNEF